MKQITFSDFFLANVNVKDFAKLMEMLTRNFQGQRVHVVNYNDWDDQQNKLMMYVRVYFQAWEAGEDISGTTHTFKAHRAKDFSCANYVIEVTEKIVKN